MVIYRGIFFIFRKLWLWWATNVVKGQKRPKMGKKLVCTLSKEIQVIWLWFLVHTCKMIISPGSFLIFMKILIFWATNEQCSQMGPFLRDQSLKGTFFENRSLKVPFLSKKSLKFFKRPIFLIAWNETKSKMFQF